MVVLALGTGRAAEVCTFYNLQIQQVQGLGKKHPQSTHNRLNMGYVSSSDKSMMLLLDNLTFKWTENDLLFSSIRGFPFVKFQFFLYHHTLMPQ